METSKKREIPRPLRTVLAVDAYLTDVLIKSVEKFVTSKQLKAYYKVLEILCDGIVWLTTNLVLVWLFNNKDLYQMQINLLMGLVVDIIFVAVLKAFTRRRRPTNDDHSFHIGPDKYSFPSGHASRSTFVVYFFFKLWPISSIYTPFLLVWCFSVCLSRILMRKHHILDILAGVAIGILVGLLISYIYLEQETCVNLISWITG